MPAAAKPVPIETPPQGSIDTVQQQSVEKVIDSIIAAAVEAVEPTSNAVEQLITPVEIVTTTETVTSIETQENKTDLITSESETVSNIDTDTTKLSEPENNEMTSK